jgi:hypothetical protein
MKLFTTALCALLINVSVSGQSECSACKSTPLVITSEGKTLQGLYYSSKPVCLLIDGVEGRVEIEIKTNVVVNWVTVNPEPPKEALKLEDLAVSVDEHTNPDQMTVTNRAFIGAGITASTSWDSGWRHLNVVYRYVSQVGTATTNRVMRITHGGKTQEAVLAVLGADTWPSRRRTLTLTR